jgi:hypothetical protein
VNPLHERFLLCLTFDGKREYLDVDFALSIKSFEALKYNWKTKNLYVKSWTILIRVKSDEFVKSRLDLLLTP